MTTFSGNKYTQAVEAARFSHVHDGNVEQFEAVKKALLDWAHSNVYKISEIDRKRSYLNKSEQGLEFATVKRNGHTYFSIKFSRAVTNDGANNLIATTEVVVRGGEGDIAVEVSKAYQKRSHARAALELQMFKPPSILSVLAPLIPFKIDDKLLSVKPEIIKDEEATIAETRRVVGLMPGAARPIKNPTPRKLPIVIALEPKTGKTKWRENVDRIASELYGFARVSIIPEEHADVWNGKFPPNQKWKLEHGDVRFFKPSFAVGDEVTKHPRLLDNVDAFVHQALKDSLTPDVPVERLPSFKELFEDAVSLAYQADDGKDPSETVRLLQEEIGVLKGKLEESDLVNEMLEDDVAKYRGRLEVANQRLADLERQNTDLTARLKASDKEVERLKAEVAALKPNAAWTIAAFVATEPLTGQVSNVTEWAKKHFPDSLVILKQFQDQCDLKKYSRYQKTEKLYQALAIMGVYYSDDPKWKELLDKPENKTEKEKWYKADGTKRPIVEVMEKYSLQWGQSGDNNTRAFKDYRPEFEGKEVVLSEHVKDNYSGANDLMMFRLYYGVAQRPQTKGPGVAAYVGAGPHHLPTQTGF